MKAKIVSITLVFAMLAAGLVIVAAGNVKAATLNVGEGQTYTTVKAAVAAAAAGDTILIKNGVYNIKNADKVIVDKAITIQGESKAGVLLNATEQDNMMEIKAAGVTVKDLRVQGAFSTLLCVRQNDTTITNVDVVNGGGYAIAIATDVPFTLHGITITNVNAPGNYIDLSEVEDSTVTGGTMGAYPGGVAGSVKGKNVVYSGCTFQKGGVTIDATSTNIKFEGCTFHNRENTMLSINGNNNKIYNCTFNNITGDNSQGINLDGTGNEVRGCTFTACGNGISVFDKTNTISHNNFVGNVFSGVVASKSWIGEGNLINVDDNWWGDASGPYHATLNANGKGDNATGNVQFTTWLSAEATWGGTGGGGGGSTPTAPGAPTALAATAGDAYVQLTWSAPGEDGGADVTGYKIYRGTVSGTLTLLTTVTTLTYSDETVTNGNTYYYAVAAVNSVGEGAKSAELSASPAAGAAPSTSITVSPDEGTTVTINIGAGVTFTLNGASHSVTFTSITSGGVTVVISSTPQNVSLATGETKEIDADGNGKNDLSVKLNSVDASAQTASVTITEIEESSGGGGIPGFEAVTLAFAGIIALFAVAYARKRRQ